MRHSTILDKIFFALVVIMCMFTIRACAQERHFTMGWMAGINTWDTGFNDLQTPGWPAHLGGHPVGVIDLQYNFRGTGLFIELGGDPHRPREATSFSFGLRHDLYHRGRIHLYGQVSAGTFEAPSFLEYCGSYEYNNGDCGAGSKEPEYCPWAAINAGFGIRIQLTKKFSLEPARGEYQAVYGIGPRYRFLTGFRVGL